MNHNFKTGNRVLFINENDKGTILMFIGNTKVKLLNSAGFEEIVALNEIMPFPSNTHDTNAYEVSEEQFFSRGNSGGTLVSSGLDMINDIVSKRYHPSSWNIYCFQCSDGDNWPEDTKKTLELVLSSAEHLRQPCE